MLRRDELVAHSQAEAARRPDPERKNPGSNVASTDTGAGSGAGSVSDGNGDPAPAPSETETWSSFISAAVELETGQPRDGQSGRGWQATIAAAASVVTARFPCQLPPVGESEQSN